MSTDEKPEVVYIAPDQVKVGRRMRKAGNVDDLAESMDQLGLLNPITIRRDGTLVAGANRVKAAQELGWSAIPAIFSDLDDLHVQLAEIDENLSRKELNPLEQGEHLDRRDEILAAINRAPKVGAPTTNENGETRFTIADQAAWLELSERSVQYRKQIARNLPQEARDVLRELDIADHVSELVTLVRLYQKKPEYASSITEYLGSHPKVQSVHEAQKALAVPAPVVPEDVVLDPEPAALEDLDLESDAESYDGPGDDVTERLINVRVEVIIHQRVQNPEPRMRGDDVAYREKVTQVRPLEIIQCADDVLEGEEGLARMFAQVGQLASQQLSDEGWPTIGKPTKKSATARMSR